MVKLEPGMTDVDSFGQFEGFTHAATIFFLDHAKKMEEVATAISEILQGEKNVVFGITRMAVNGVCIKVLGFKGEQLFDIARKIANLSTGRFSVAPASH